MKTEVVGKNLLFYPKDAFDYFLLGRISKRVEHYSYDFERAGEERIIALFRVGIEEIVNILAEL